MRIRTFRFYKGLSAVLPPEVLKMGMSEGRSRQGFCPRCRAADEVASQYNRLAHSATLRTISPLLAPRPADQAGPDHLVTISQKETLPVPPTRQSPAVLPM